MVRKTAAIIQIVIVSLIIIFGTICLYTGNFEGMFATFPFLFVYYVFVIARQNRKKRFENSEADERLNPEKPRVPQNCSQSPRCPPGGGASADKPPVIAAGGLNPCVPAPSGVF